MEQEFSCSFLKDAKLKVEKASKQLNLLGINNGQLGIKKHKRDDTGFFDTFVYRDHVTFKNIEAKYLQKQKKCVPSSSEQRNMQQHQESSKTIKNLKLITKKSTSSQQKPLNNLNKDLIIIWKYIRELKMIQKYRNQELMRNARKNTSLRVKKKERNARNDRNSYFEGLEICQNTNTQKNDNIRQQIQELKKQVKMLNQGQMRKYLQQEIGFAQINQSLVEIEKYLDTYSQKIKKDSHITALTSGKLSPKPQQVREPLQPIQNIDNTQSKAYKCLLQFQEQFPILVHARVGHQTRYNWQKPSKKHPLKVTRNSLRSYRNSLN